MKFLRRQPPYEDAIRPDIVLLDLNLPKMDGREVLQELKSDPELGTIPVVILTTSNSERDIIDSYRLQAAGYVHKPVTLDEFKQVMGKIEEYWFVLCKLPRQED